MSAKRGSCQKTMNGDDVEKSEGEMGASKYASRVASAGDKSDIGDDLVCARPMMQGPPDGCPRSRPLERAYDSPLTLVLRLSFTHRKHIPHYSTKRYSR